MLNDSLPDRVTCPDWCVVGLDEHRRDFPSAGVVHHDSVEARIPTVDHDPVTVGALVSCVPNDATPELHVRLTEKLLNPVQARALILALQHALDDLEDTSTHTALIAMGGAA